MGSSGLEPPTSRLSGARSNHLSYEPIQFPRCVSRLLSLSVFSTDGGDEGNRTLDPLLAGQVLSQLSYTPDCEVSQAISCLFVTLRSLKIEQQQTHTQKLVYSLAVRKKLFWFWSISKLRAVSNSVTTAHVLHRKEVIQPHLPIRLPCYDLTPIIEPTFDCCLLAVSSQASGVPNFHGLTGGVYKARERIHRGMLIRDY